MCLVVTFPPHVTEKKIMSKKGRSTIKVAEKFCLGCSWTMKVHL